MACMKEEGLWQVNPWSVGKPTWLGQADEDRAVLFWAVWKRIDRPV